MLLGFLHAFLAKSGAFAWSSHVGALNVSRTDKGCAVLLGDACESLGGFRGDG